MSEASEVKRLRALVREAVRLNAVRIETTVWSDRNVREFERARDKWISDCREELRRHEGKS